MDVTEIMNYLLTPAAQVALIIGLAEVCKRSGCPKRIIPLIDLMLGIISGVCVYTIGGGLPIIEGIVMGIALGLAACGLFSGIKNTIEKTELK